MFVNKLSDHCSRRHSPTPTDGLSCATAPRTPSVIPSVETASPQATSFSECAGGWEKTTPRMPRSTWISLASSERHTNSKVGKFFLLCVVLIIGIQKRPQVGVWKQKNLLHFLLVVYIFHRDGRLSVPSCAFRRWKTYISVRQNHPPQSRKPRVLWAADALLPSPRHLLPPRQSGGLLLPAWRQSKVNDWVNCSTSAKFRHYFPQCSYTIWKHYIFPHADAY